MSIVGKLRSSGAATALLVATYTLPAYAQAQAPAGAQTQEHQHEGHQGHVMPQADDASAHAGHEMASMAREGSGTSWLPDESPMYAVHATKDGWMLMLHGNVFLQYLQESGDRGDDQAGSINWVMGMARRKFGPGQLTFRSMVSFEPWSIRGCGYPDLLATGEECGGDKIHDRQHPHDLFMELAAEYHAPLGGSVQWQVYGGPAGEPALGPVAFPHRLSAMPNPVAPVTHHWLDATHVTFGVITGGVYGERWKAEASVFNGREPDERRTDFDFAALDSASGRFWFLPTRNWAFQISAGKLSEAEAGDHGGPRIDVTRVTASGTYHTEFREDSLWATTVAWGRNDEPGRASNALLVETNVTLAQRDTWYGRFETASKSAHDLVVPEPPDAFTIARLQGGYTRYFRVWNQLQPGIGAGISVSIVPESLKDVYGSRTNPGTAIYLTLRPAAIATH